MSTRLNKKSPPKRKRDHKFQHKYSVIDGKSLTGKVKETNGQRVVRYVDLFCGIGGFRVAMESVSESKRIKPICVFSSDIDEKCQQAYEANFGERPFGDITQFDAEIIPDHDVLLAGFPCQPFSIIGQMKGFEDTRGTLFFDIARILQAKKHLFTNVQQNSHNS